MTIIYMITPPNRVASLSNWALTEDAAWVYVKNICIWQKILFFQRAFTVYVYGMNNFDTISADHGNA